jgi:hypothetical protein
MSSMRRLETEKLRTRRIIATAALTVFTIAVLLLKETSAASGATPPGARPSYQAADQRFPSEPAEAEEMPAGQAPGEAAAQYRDPDDSAGENKAQTASTARPVRPQEQ